MSSSSGSTSRLSTTLPIAEFDPPEDRFHQVGGLVGPGLSELGGSVDSPCLDSVHRVVVLYGRLDGGVYWVDLWLFVR
jgi:hypothetical protein